MSELTKEFKEGRDWEKIGDIWLPLPFRPKRIEVIGNDLPKKDQKFRRTEEIEDLTFMRQLDYDDNGGVRWTKQQNDFIIRELYRRVHGIWIMINGTPTFIPPHQYFELNYCKLPEGIYKEYRDTDRRTHTFFWGNQLNSKVLGVIVGKQRRRGLTTSAIAINLNMMTHPINTGKKAGIQSKNDKDCKNDVFNPLTDVLLGLPTYFQPIRKGTDRPEEKIEFFEPAGRRTKNKQTNFQSIALNNTIDYRATLNKAYDGSKLLFYHLNEAGKIKPKMESDLNGIWNTVKECLVTGNKRVGFGLLESTVEDMDVGGEDFHRLWNNSDYNNLSKNKQTKSGLVRLFCSAEDGLEGYIGEYGESIIETPNPEQKHYLIERNSEADPDDYEFGARDYLLNRREALLRDGDFQELSVEKRKYPLSPEEMFSFSSEYCHFNREKLEHRIATLMSMKSAGELARKIVRGNLEWKEKDKTVAFYPSNSGKWEFTWQFDDASKEANKIEYSGGQYSPKNQTSFAIGCDPFKFDQPKDPKRASKWAAYVFKKHNPFSDEEYNHAFIGQYLCRTPTTEESYEDMIKACVFFGCEIHYESQLDSMMKYFRDRWFINFVMKRPEITQTNNTKVVKRVERGTPSSELTKRIGFEEIAVYVEDYLDKLYFIEVAEDWLKIQINNTQIYDAGMGAMWTLVGLKKLVRREHKTTEITGLIRAYRGGSRVR